MTRPSPCWTPQQIHKIARQAQRPPSKHRATAPKHILAGRDPTALEEAAREALTRFLVTNLEVHELRDWIRGNGDKDFAKDMTARIDAALPGREDAA